MLSQMYRFSSGVYQLGVGANRLFVRTLVLSQRHGSSVMIVRPVRATLLGNRHHAVPWRANTEIGSAVAEPNSPVAKRVGLSNMTARELTLKINAIVEQYHAKASPLRWVATADRSSPG